MILCGIWLKVRKSLMKIGKICLMMSFQAILICFTMRFMPKSRKEWRNNLYIKGDCKTAVSFFGLLPHRSQPSGWTIQLHRCKRYLRWFCLAQIKDIMLGHFVFIPYNGYVVGFSLYLYLRRLNPFPAFSSRNNVGDPSREDRETALMRCMHHLRAASGEWSNIHVGLVATTPLFEEETYRKVCRMGRDAPFSAKMNHAHLHQGAILLDTCLWHSSYKSLLL